tara:strand:- start:5520 stop:6626 length:1107 start_codon:yes stop_codon:yes gene_type:complete
MKKNIKTLLFIHPYFGNGGAEKGIKILAKGLILNGYLVDIFCIKVNKKTILENSENMAFYKSPSKSIIKSFFFFTRLLFKKKYDVIIPTQSPSISFYTPLIYLFNYLSFRKKRIKIISYERLSPEAFYYYGKSIFPKKFLYYLAIRLSDCVLTNSYEQLLDYKKKFPKKLSFYIPNSCSIEHLNNSKDKFSKKVDFYKILWAGRLEEIKDPKLALRTITKLDNKYKLYIFGSGKLNENLKEEIIRLSLNEKISFNNDFNKLNMNDYDLILNTSLYEGLPNILIEGLSNNIPIVSTFFTTGLIELFIPYWIYPSPRSENELAKLIKKALSENDTLIRKKVPINHLIENYYNSEKMVSKFQNILKNELKI